MAILGILTPLSKDNMLKLMGKREPRGYDFVGMFIEYSILSGQVLSIERV